VVTVTARRLRGELRRLAHPTVLLAVVLVAIGCCAAQASSSGADLRPPSPIDATGSLRIAAQHHASTLGFLLVAVMAATTTATDVRIGAVGSLRMADPQVAAGWRRRVGVAVIVAVVSIGCSAVAVWVTRSATACRAGCPPGSTSTLGATAVDLLAAGLVLVFAASFATALAVWFGSELATVVLAVAAYSVPANRIGSSYGWALPTKWVSQVMQFEPYGLGSDFTGGAAATASRGGGAVVGAVLLASGTVVAAWAAIGGLRRRAAAGPPT
jgi:hypothetical protein